MNSLARGSGKAVEILSWIITAIAVVWLLLELFVDNRFVRTAFGLVEFGLLLAIFGLSYSVGWV